MHWLQGLHHWLEWLQGLHWLQGLLMLGLLAPVMLVAAFWIAAGNHDRRTI